MKILMTADTVGGVWTFALELAAALGARGIEVILATQGPRASREQRAAALRIDTLTLAESQYKLEWMEDPWDDVRTAGDWLLTLEAKLAPDVVHFNDYSNAARAFAAPVLVAGHSCVLSWYESVRGHPAPPSWQRYRDAVAAGLHAADAVVAPSRWMLGELQRFYGPLPSPQVIANGRDPNRFRPTAKEPFVLGAGRLWDDAKNVTVLDTIAARLDWPVYLAGARTGPGVEVSLQGGSRWLGLLSPEALAGSMARASIFAMPARYEPFGLSAVEAALSGCALVLGDIPSLREVWGDAALYVAPNDAEALRAALQRLIADAALRAALAQTARARARAYAPESMAYAYAALYRELATRGRRPDAPTEDTACVS